METIQQKIMGIAQRWVTNSSHAVKGILTLLLLSFSIAVMAKDKPFEDKDYHHWADKIPDWVNSDLNKNNSSYKEGDVVPHVYNPTGLTKDKSYSVTIRYDYYLSNKNAGGFFAFTLDPSTFSKSPTGYYNENDFPAANGTGTFAPYYATNIVINAVTQLPDDVTNSGSISKYVRIDFTFTGNDGDPAALYFGLQLAKKGDIANANGASAWAGASLDTRLNPSSNPGSRTLSIQAKQISSSCDNPPTASISGTSSVCKGDAASITFSATGGTPPYTFYYTGPDGNPGQISTTGENTSVTLAVSTTTPGSYTYTLDAVSGQNCSNSAEGSATITVKDISSTPTVSNPNPLCVGDPAPNLANYVSGSNLLWYSTAKSNDGTSTVPNVSTATDGTFYFYVSQTEAGKCESERAVITLVVNPLPPCNITPTTGNPEVGQTYKFSADADYTYAWSIDATAGSNTANASIVGSSTSQDVYVKTTSVGKYTLKLTITNSTTGCYSNCSRLVNVDPSAKYTTYTKGFWGNAGGKFCGSSDATAPLKAMYNAFGGYDSKTFGTGSFAFTLKRDAVTNTAPTGKPAFYQIYQLLPGGSTPAVLTGNASSDPATKTGWSNVPIDKTSGSILNNLLAQGIAMFFNMANDPTVGSAVLYGNKLTFTANNSCASGSNTQTIPICVYNAAKDGDGKVTVQSVYSVAMAVLGKGNTNISAPDANAALNALNVGFDKGAKITAVTMDNTPCSVTKAVNVFKENTLETTMVNTLTVSAYPNPFTDKIRFTIQAPKAGRATLEVYNMLGQKVGVPFEGLLNAGETRNVDYTAPVNSRTNLIYMLRMNGEQVSGKLMSTKQ